MTEHVHRHGRRYTREQLLENATGQGLEPSFYIEHLTSKYSEIYGLCHDGGSPRLAQRVQLKDKHIITRMMEIASTRMM